MAPYPIFLSTTITATKKHPDAVFNTVLNNNYESILFVMYYFSLDP